MPSATHSASPAGDPPALTVVVPGLPIGQGRLSSMGPGRMVHSNAKTLLPWREQIAAHTRWAMNDAGITEPLEGPMALTATFTMPRPKSAPKSRWAPDRRPDLSHLLRALEDATVLAAAVVDDSQYVDEHVAKVYGPLPGVTFTISPAVRGEQVAA